MCRAREIQNATAMSFRTFAFVCGDFRLIRVSKSSSSSELRCEKESPVDTNVSTWMCCASMCIAINGAKKCSECSSTCLGMFTHGAMGSRARTQHGANAPRGDRVESQLANLIVHVPDARKQVGGGERGMPDRQRRRAKCVECGCGQWHTRHAAGAPKTKRYCNHARPQTHTLSVTRGGGGPWPPRHVPKGKGHWVCDPGSRTESRRKSVNAC